MSDEAVSALKHFRCDACDRLKRPPSKRSVAVNHAETFNDIVSMDVNFWKITFKEFPRVKTTLKVLNIVDTASGMHIAIQIADKTAETIWKAFATGWLRWAGSPRCLRVDPHRSQTARGFFDKAEGRGIFVEPTPAEAHWQMGQVENNARYLREMGHKILEDIDVSQSDFQTLLDELTDAKNSLVTIPRVPGHLGRFRRIAEMRHKCRMAAIETEANAKIRKSLIGRSRPMRGNYVPGDLEKLLASRNWCASSTRSVAGTSSGHRNRRRKCLGITSCDSYQVCRGAGSYGITRRARDARNADEDWRRRSR